MNMRNEARHRLTRLALLAATLFVAAVCLTGCEVEKAVTDFAGRLLNAKPEERAKMLAETPQNQRDAVLRQVYGANLIYLSPEAQAQLFTSEENFIFGVLAPGWETDTDFSFKSVIALPGEGVKNSPGAQQIQERIADLVALGPSLPGIAAANLATLKLASGSFVNPRVEAIKQRLGSNQKLFAKMDERDLRDLIWDDSKFSQFMHDDKFAIDYVARAAHRTDIRKKDDNGDSLYRMTRDTLGPAGGGSARTGT
jgi:hypothetical protein